MKTNDLVTLIHLNQHYISKNLYVNAHGIIIDELQNNKYLVLFFNDKIVGDYAIVEVEGKDLKVENHQLPQELSQEFKNKLNNKNLFKKQSFKKLEFNECDFVELLVEDEKYSNCGIHKGAVGIVAIDYAVGNNLLVDFSGVDENGEYYGDCIEVDINHLKLIKNN